MDNEVFSEQYELSPDQGAKFFVSPLSGPARDFYFQNTRSRMPFKELVHIMVEK